MNFINAKKNFIFSFKIGFSIWDSIKHICSIYNVYDKTKFYFFKKMTINFLLEISKNPIKLEIRSNKGSDAFIFSEIFINYCYAIPLLAAPKTILDLGANVGFTAIFYANIFPKTQIVCVEPMPQNILQLTMNLAYNNVEAKIYNAAIAIHDGNISMGISDKDYGHKVSNIPYGKNINNSSEIEVKGITILSLLKELEWEEIDLLKIDIEGYEGVLLMNNNTWLERVNTIIMELHEGILWEDMINVAKEFKFYQFKNFNGNLLMSKGYIKE